MTIDNLKVAITKSGYPLQATIADIIRDSFSRSNYHYTIQEEWAYVDADTNEIRSIDIFTEVPLVKPPIDFRLSVTPHLNLLVECKQNEMPYIFFLREETPSNHYDFPEICGLPSIEIALPSEEGGEISKYAYSMTLHYVFNIWEFGFFEFPCSFAISASKAAWKKGGEIELTGEDAYRSLTLPLMKAADHLKQIAQPQSRSSDAALACRMTICLAVLRAPMYGVIRTEHGDRLSPLPWVRMCRLEPQPGLPFRTVSNVRYYDCVREVYLSRYLTSMLNDIKVLASRIEKSADVIADGKGVSAQDAKDVYPTLRRLSPEESQATSKVKARYRISRTRNHFRFGPPASKDNPSQQNIGVEDA